MALLWTPKMYLTYFWGLSRNFEMLLTSYDILLFYCQCAEEHPRPPTGGPNSPAVYSHRIWLMLACVGKVSWRKIWRYAHQVHQGSMWTVYDELPACCWGALQTVLRSDSGTMQVKDLGPRVIVSAVSCCTALWNTFVLHLVLNSMSIGLYVYLLGIDTRWKITFAYPRPLKSQPNGVFLKIS
jgi:hypothetical protein